MIELLHAAARGAFPPEDGQTDVLGAVEGAPAAVLSFTAHHVVAADVPAEEVLARVDPQDLKGPLAPGVLAWLAERTGLVAGSLDVDVRSRSASQRASPSRERLRPWRSRARAPARRRSRPRRTR